jgi:hypothetical protein
METKLEYGVNLKVDYDTGGRGVILYFEKFGRTLTITKDNNILFNFLDRAKLVGFQIVFSDSIIDSPMTQEEIETQFDIYSSIKDGFSDLFRVAIKNISMLNTDIDIVALVAKQTKESDVQLIDATKKKTNRLYIVTINGEYIPNVKVACEILDIDLPNVYKKLKKQDYYLSQIINKQHLIIKEYEG